jgi:enoyl-CoA hydratase/carnithine racemase
VSSGKKLVFETVTYETKNSIAIITFSRPEKLNAQNEQLSKDFLSALKEAAMDDEVHVIIIKGDGRAFCSGHDLK